MKKLLFTAFVLYSLNFSYAQEGEDVGWVARFGAAGGITPAFVFPNFAPFNSEIKRMGIPELSTSGMFLLGGGGYAYIMIVDNLRIGGIGIGGTQSTSGFVDGFNREVRYNFGLGGFTVEYTFPFIKNIAVSLGAIVGAGSLSVEIYQNQNNFSWDNIWNYASDPKLKTQNISTNISNTFVTVTPTLNIDIPLNRFIAFRVGGGYITSFTEDWKVDNNKSFTGIPSDLNNQNSFFIQTGIYVGLFAF